MTFREFVEEYDTVDCPECHGTHCGLKVVAALSMYPRGFVSQGQLAARCPVTGLGMILPVLRDDEEGEEWEG